MSYTVLIADDKLFIREGCVSSSSRKMTSRFAEPQKTEWKRSRKLTNYTPI